MATSSCVATSTRLAATSSCRARTKRTLSIHPPMPLNTTRTGIRPSHRVWYQGSTSRSIGGGVAIDCPPILPRTLSSMPVGVPPLAPAAKYWLGHLRRYALSLQKPPAQSRKDISTIMACTLCFLASAASATTDSQQSVGHTPTTPVSKRNSGGGGFTPRRMTQPVLLCSKEEAEEEVRKVENDARENPYLVSEGIFQGARWTMEDTYKVENGGRFLAVFDGHGGAEVSSILQERLYDLYCESLAKKHWEEQNEFGANRKSIPSKSSHIAAMQRGLEQVEDAILKLDELVYQGSTAVSVVLHVAQSGKRTLLTANVGDSRAILCRKGKAIDMTRDHKPGDDQERKRIEAMGEEIEWDPFGQVYRVRDLSLSRAIGDRFAKPVVSSEPEIMTFPVVDDEDEFVLLASDGLWDVMSSQEVVDFVSETLSAQIENYSEPDKRKNMALIIANEALERGSADNVCVVLVWLAK